MEASTVPESEAVKSGQDIEFIAVSEGRLGNLKHSTIANLLSKLVILFPVYTSKRTNIPFCEADSLAIDLLHGAKDNAGIKLIFQKSPDCASLDMLHITAYCGGRQSSS